jgi:hypothetical protein
MISGWRARQSKEARTADSENSLRFGPKIPGEAGGSNESVFLTSPVAHSAGHDEEILTGLHMAFANLNAPGPYFIPQEGQISVDLRSLRDLIEERRSDRRHPD